MTSFKSNDFVTDENEVVVKHYLLRKIACELLGILTLSDSKEYSSRDNEILFKKVLYVVMYIFHIMKSLNQSMNKLYLLHFKRAKEKRYRKRKAKQLNSLENPILLNEKLLSDDIHRFRLYSLQ